MQDAELTRKIRQLMARLDFMPSRLELLKHLFIDGALLATVGYLNSLHHWWATIAAQVVLPVFFFRSFALMHDSVHNSASTNKVVNDLVGYFAGAFCFLPFAPWRAIHLKHHYWAGNIDQDPTMKIIKTYDLKNTAKNGFMQFAWKSWIPLLAVMQHFVFWLSGPRILKSTTKTFPLLAFAFSYLVPVTCYGAFIYAHIFQLPQLLLALVVYLEMVEIINFPHHLQLPQFRDNTVLPVWLQHKVCRSCTYPTWFAKHIINYFNLHTEHHIFVRLPWYRLLQVRPLVKEVLGGAYNESVNSEWIFKNRNKDIHSVLISATEPEQKNRRAA